ncbi:MAG: hypothetical protein CFE21_17495 [Bacteroidetes bacterium B1(2017)]|nr:MAG: hypothetical protein CFE21_17495 [Bacteroidetes bacterium B1(2017)]
MPIPSLRFYKDIKTERGSARPDVANCCEVVIYMEMKFEHEKDKLLSPFRSEDRWTWLLSLKIVKSKVEH